MRTSPNYYNWSAISAQKPHQLQDSIFVFFPKTVKVTQRLKCV